MDQSQVVLYALIALVAGALIVDLAYRRRLARSSQQNRTMMDLAEGFFLFHARADGPARLRLVAASKSIARILGFPLDHWSDPEALVRCVHVDDQHDFLAALAYAITNRAPLRVRFRLSVHHDGKVRHLLLQAVPLSDSVPLEFEGLCLDLSAETEAETAIRDMQRRLALSQRHESLGLLAGGVAHDFNNLLGAIRGNAELALTGLPESHPTRRRIDRVLMAADRAAGLVRQILAYAGRGSVEVRSIDLAEELKVLGELLRHSVPKNVRIQLELATGLPRILFDPSQLQQVLVNLIVNAAESYEGRDGTVTVTLAAAGPGRIAIQVADRGCGMDEQTQARMFEPYFTTKKQGHGLGLAAVLGILQQAKATLDCQSQKGRGTTFTVTLIATTTTPEAVTADTEPMPRGRHLLVADDDELMREITVTMARELGFTCDLAATGGEAARFLAQPGATYAAAIIDCVMPERDGTEVVRDLRRGGSRLPVLLVSGMIDDHKLGTGILDRRTRFLPKPFSKAMLDRTLQALLRPGRDEDSSVTFANLMRESSVHHVIRTPPP